MHFNVIQLPKHFRFYAIPPDCVGKFIMLSGCPSATFVCSFIWTHLVSTISHERLEHCWWNLQWIFIIHYWL